jgi:hypothetical protein
MKVVDPDAFVRAKLGSLGYAEVVQHLALQWSRDDRGKRSNEFADKWWKHCLGHTPDADCARTLLNYDMDEPTEVVPLLANSMVDSWIG